MSDKIQGTISPIGQLGSGAITPGKQKLEGTISPLGKIESKLSFDGEIKVYRGDYEVTPKAFEDVTLETAHKIMTDDVVVHKVPYIETHNKTGLTVYIATEVGQNGN